MPNETKDPFAAFRVASDTTTPATQAPTPPTPPTDAFAQFRVEETPTAVGPETGLLEDATDTAKAFGHGVEKGATFGFSEKLRAFGTSISPLQLLPGFQSLTYEEALAQEREESKKIAAKAPTAALAGDIAGSLLIPGAAAKAGISTVIKTGAAIGGLEAAGRTEKDLLTSEGLIDVAQGVGLGAVAGAAGHAIGKGIQKVGAKIKTSPTDILSGAKIREKAMHKTPTVKSKEQKFVKEQVKNKDAIEVGERLGVFKDASLDELVPNVQTQLSQVGAKLGATTDESVEALGALLKHTKNPARASAQKAYDKGRVSITKKNAKGDMDNDAAKRAMATYDEEFERLASMIETERSPLDAIRTLKTSLYGRLKGSDFKFGGPKAGSEKDTLLAITDDLRKMEEEALGVVGKLLKMADPEAAAKAKGLVKDHMANLKDFSNLKTLEDQLSLTVEKAGGDAGLYELSGGVAAALLDPLLGIPGFLGVRAIKVLRTPKGKFWLAKVADKINKDPGKSKTFIKNGAKALGITTEDLGKVLSKGKLISAGAAVGD